MSILVSNMASFLTQKLLNYLDFMINMVRVGAFSNLKYLEGNYLFMKTSKLVEKQILLNSEKLSSTLY